MSQRRQDLYASTWLGLSGGIGFILAGLSYDSDIPVRIPAFVISMMIGLAGFVLSVIHHNRERRNRRSVLTLVGQANPPKRRSTLFLVLGVACFFVASAAFGMGFSSGPRPLSAQETTFVLFGFPIFMILGILLLGIGIALRTRENRDHMES